MTFDWQTTVVAMSILGAIMYVGRRGIKRLRTFGAAKTGAASCETGCGSCSGSTSVSKGAVTTLVQIQGPDSHSKQMG